jgi:hypothetical protein
MITRERKRLGDGKILDDLITMAEGNVGATTVLAGILNADDLGYITILNLDDMNIRGAQIWIGYTDVCNSDLAVFMEKVKARDEAMIVAINEHLGHEGWQAVVGGASYMVERPKLERAMR